jgi:hypothetical protein
MLTVFSAFTQSYFSFTLGFLYYPVSVLFMFNLIYVPIFRLYSYFLHPTILMPDSAPVFLSKLSKISFLHICSCTTQYMAPASSLLHIGQNTQFTLSPNPLSLQIPIFHHCSSLGFPCAYEYQCFYRYCLLTKLNPSFPHF